MADNSNLLVVVDTNVPLCANGKSHVTAECVKICSREIKNIKEKGCILSCRLPTVNGGAGKKH